MDHGHPGLRKLAGFALTEPQVGSDAHGIRSRAERQGDGSYVLNGEKRYIGKLKDVLVTFAVAGEGYVALILEKGRRLRGRPAL